MKQSNQYSGKWRKCFCVKCVVILCMYVAYLLLTYSDAPLFTLIAMSAYPTRDCVCARRDVNGP